VFPLREHHGNTTGSALKIAGKPLVTGGAALKIPRSL
jgi:hypothetical protein